MKSLHALGGLSVCVLFLSACGGGGSDSGGSGSTPPPPPLTYSAQSGVAQKGPLIKGSTVTVQELSAALAPTGKQYTYQIDSDLGTFNPNSAFTSQYVGVNATGYYFDEVQNAVSGGPVTLNSYANLTSDTTLGVNLLSTLAYQRIQNLITNSHLSFADARTQAEGEVLAALNIPRGNYGSFTSLNLSGSHDGDRILAAISALFVQGNSSGPLNALIANVQSDIGTNGRVTSTFTKATLDAAAHAMDPALVAANLTQRYASTGTTFTTQDISGWIDADGDGVIGKFEIELRDASPASQVTLPAEMVSKLAGSTISASAGQISINGTPVTESAAVTAGDAVVVSPGEGAFPDGVRTVFIMNGMTKVARVAFISSLLSIEVGPAAVAIPKGLEQQFTATGTFSDGSVSQLEHVTWNSQSPGIATVNVMNGIAHAYAIGSTEIQATSGTVSGSTTLVVTPATLQALAIQPGPAVTGVGITVQLTAMGTYSDGSFVNVTNSALWSSDTPTIATVVPSNGKLIGVALGSATISAALEAQTAHLSASVTADRWYEGGPLSSRHCVHAGTQLQNGKVLIAGSWCDIGTSDKVEIYDPATNTWTNAAPMRVSRTFHTATTLQDGRVLVVGGSGGVDGGPLPALSSAEIYDPLTNMWTLTSNDMASVHWGHTATLLPNGKVLVASGFGFSGYNPDAELFDPATGMWSSAGTLAVGRGHHRAALLPDGKVLVAGGQSASPTTTVEIYDPTMNSWSQAASLPATRYVFTLTRLVDGRLFAVGGTGDADSASTLFYDPVADAWTPGPSMAHARVAHSMTQLNDGTFLAAGGSTDKEAERYDPVANVWLPAGNLLTNRSQHTAALLPSGAVLIAGGTGTGPSASLTSELH